MKKIALIGMGWIFFLWGCTSTTTESDPYDTNNNVYLLDLYLDPEHDTLEVEGELNYQNDEIDLEELYVMVYPNADNPTALDNNIVFDYFRIEGVDTAFEITGEDQSALHFILEETVPKGQRITLSFRYHFQYWDHDRILAAENYYLTLFFYPCVAMIDETGWNVEPYSFRGETYYNDIGDYYVTLNVPEDYLVACGGKKIEETSESGRKTQKYVLLDARDFSFSASSDYHLYERTFQGVDVEIYAIRELTETEIDESFGYLETTMTVMEREIGDYTYDHFTLEYGNFYGMESSGVIYCSSQISEGTVVHELIHQWFYSMIGNDQADESFLDEALTTYAASFYYYELYGLEGYNGYLNYRTSLKPELADRYEANLGVSLLRQVDEYGEYYGFLIYYHGPAMFRYYVEEFLDGDIPKMMEILKVYYDTFAKKNATLDQFLDLLERESGAEITKEWFYLQLNEFQDFENRP